MNIVKTTLLVLTLGLGLVAGSVKADPLCKCLTEADLVKTLSNGELVKRFMTDQTARMLGNSHAGAELIERAIRPVVRGVMMGAMSSLAFIKQHPSLARYSAAVSAGFCGALLLRTAINKMVLKNKAMKEEQLQKA